MIDLDDDRDDCESPDDYHDVDDSGIDDSVAHPDDLVMLCQRCTTTLAPSGADLDCAACAEEAFDVAEPGTDEHDDARVRLRRVWPDHPAFAPKPARVAIDDEDLPL